MRIVVEGNFAPTGSYGIVNWNLARSLAKVGHEVSVVALDLKAMDIERELHRCGSDAGLTTGEPQANVDVRIRQLWPPVWSKRNANELLVVVQPWEFGSLPLDWIDDIRNVDCIWVPSEFVKRGYLQSGIPEEKVWVVPNGVEDLVVQEKTVTGNEKLNLLFLGGSIHRKGIDSLIRGLNGLSDSQLTNVSLVVKEVGGDSYYRGQSILEKELELNPRVAEITTVNRKFLTREQLFTLMRESDLLVHPYRAEGFGLPVLEAMTMGLPVLHTDGGATNEFCGPEESILIPSSLVVSQDPYVGDQRVADQVYWLEPKVEAITNLLELILDGRVDLRARAKAAAARAENYRWDRIGELASVSLERLCIGGRPDDRFSRLMRDLSLWSRGNDVDLVSLLSGLSAIGDIESSFQIVDYTVRMSSQPPKDSLLQIRDSLRIIRDSRPDIWSGGPYRSLVGKRIFTKVGVSGYEHSFEGSIDDTTRIARQLSKYFSGCESVLDIGCGQGSMLRVLRASGRKVQGIESDPVLVDILIHQGFRVHVGRVPDGLQTLEPAEFDGVFLGHIVEHLTPSEFETVLSWVWERIADGGILVIQTPDFTNHAVAFENFWLDGTHIRPYPVRLLKEMLAKAGFIPIEGACGRIPHIAPLDALVVGRRVPRPSEHESDDHLRVEVLSRKRAVHFGIFEGESGFAVATKSLLDAEALSRFGCDLIEVSVTGRNSESTQDVPRISFERVCNLSVDLAIVDVPLGWLDQVMSRVRAGVTVVRSTYEASPIPGAISRLLRGVDEVWCFSEYDRDIFVSSLGSAEGVEVVAPGIRRQNQAEVERIRGSLPPRRPRLLSIFEFSERKNPSALFKAFSRILGAGYEADLVAKVGGISLSDFRSWLQTVLSPLELERVSQSLTVVTERYDRAAMDALYLLADVFILPTRGEGFGLPFLEALSFGVPTIAPDRGGHRLFCDETNSLLVHSSELAATTLDDGGIFLGSVWRDCDIDDLTTALESVVGDLGLRKSLSSRAWNVAERFGIDLTRNLTSQRVRTLLSLQS